MFAIWLPALTHFIEGAEKGLGLADAELHPGVGEACVDHLGPPKEQAP